MADDGHLLQKPVPHIMLLETDGEQIYEIMNIDQKSLLLGIVMEQNDENSQTPKLMQYGQVLEGKVLCVNVETILLIG